MSDDVVYEVAIEYKCGVRTVKEYPLTETEMFLLEVLPWFARHRLIKRIRAETVFDD